MIEQIKKINEEYHYFNSLATDQEILEQEKNSKGLLKGKYISRGSGGDMYPASGKARMPV